MKKTDEHEDGIEGVGAEPPPKPTVITQAQLCANIAQVIDKNLLAMTGTAEGHGPAFALIMWRDGDQPVDFSTNRSMDETFVRAHTVLAHIAAETRESQKPPVVVVAR